MRRRGTFAIAGLALVAAAAQAADLTVRLDPIGTCQMVEAPARALEDQAPVEVTLKGSMAAAAGPAKRARAVFAAEDLWGRPVGWRHEFVTGLPADGAAVNFEVPLKLPVGFYRLVGQFECGPDKVEQAADLAIVPPHREGLRPDSFFASNTSSVRTGKELRLLQMVGMKVQRTHFMPRVVGKPPEPSAGAALAVNFDDLDRRFQESREAGLWVLPIVGYAFEGTASETARALGMYGPPRNYDEFVRTWEAVVRRYPQVLAWEFWNEPWIFGWTWAASSEEYRKLHTAWCRMALGVNPNLRILAGNSSMFAEDHIEPYPDCWKGLLAGTTHHPYSGAGLDTMRGGAQARSIDHGFMVTRRMGLAFYYLTEGGTEWKEGGSPNCRVNARKAVQYAVRSALVGAFQTNLQWGIGYGPEWTRSNQALAVLAHLVEDRPVVADVWPTNELIYGAIFAHPRHVTDAVRKLPRAADLDARWAVRVPDDRKGDATKVAVLWSHTGKSNRELDAGGTLTIGDAAGLRAFDLTGREIRPAGRKLTVPFTEDPVYVTTDDLGVLALLERLAHATVANVTPVNLYALSLAEPADRPQALAVRVENQLNRTVRGRLLLDAGQGAAPSEVPLDIRAGQLVEVPILWPGLRVSPQNEYAVTLTARTDAGDVVRRQVVAAARFVRRAVDVDGRLEDWAGTAPVLLDSDRLRTGADLATYLLAPHLERPTGTAGQKRIVARIYTAYDDKNVYLAAEVNEDALACAAGRPVVKAPRRGGEPVRLPYREAMPDGLGHIRLAGDAFAFAFGFRDRVPGWGRPMDDPYAWKGHFHDTDYHYVAHVSTDGDQLLRQWGPDTPRRTAYQTDKVPGCGPVPGAKIVIRRRDDVKVTVYEMAIPRAELAMFDPARGRCRFGFILCNNERLGLQGGLEWSEAAGVFDHWYSSGSFGPSWMSVLPCQTFFGIEKEGGGQ